MHRTFGPRDGRASEFCSWPGPCRRATKLRNGLGSSGEMASEPVISRRSLSVSPVEGIRKLPGLTNLAVTHTSAFLSPMERNSSRTALTAAPTNVRVGMRLACGWLDHPPHRAPAGYLLWRTLRPQPTGSRRWGSAGLPVICIITNFFGGICSVHPSHRPLLAD